MVVGSYRRGFDDLNTSCLNGGSLCRMSNFRNHSCRLPLAFPCPIPSVMLSCHMSNSRKKNHVMSFTFLHRSIRLKSHVELFAIPMSPRRI